MSSEGKRKVLVTGGAGFVGSHVVEAFIEAGHPVVVVDSLITGRRENLHPQAKFYELDIRDPALDELIAEEQPEVVSHQAALANVRESLEKPMEYADVNIRGGVNLLEGCRRHGVRKIIYASSGGCAYGEATYFPTNEQHPTQPQDPYGVSKVAFELYLPGYRVNYGLQFTVLRYANVYGPRQDPLGEAGVVAIFTRKMLSGEQVTMNGDGEQQRDFIYVKDVARANVMAFDAGDGAVYNLGCGHGVSINELFRKLKLLTGSTQEQIHGPAKLGEVRVNRLSSERIRRELGWEPRVIFEEGLRQTVESFRAAVRQ